MFDLNTVDAACRSRACDRSAYAFNASAAARISTVILPMSAEAWVLNEPTALSASFDAAMTLSNPASIAFDMSLPSRLNPSPIFDDRAFVALASLSTDPTIPSTRAPKSASRRLSAARISWVSKETRIRDSIGRSGTAR